MFGVGTYTGLCWTVARRLPAMKSSTLTELMPHPSYRSST